MRQVVLFVALLLGRPGAVDSTPPDSFPNSAYLDAVRIEKAIEWGNDGQPRPYLLFSETDKSRPTVAVYTPFVRVALAAHDARRRGLTLSAGQLPQWIIEPRVHVVVRPPRYVDALLEAFPDASSVREIPITQIALSRRGVIFLDYTAPLSLIRDLSYLNAIGGSPFADALAAAVFEPTQMTLGLDVYGWWRKDNLYFPLHGVLDSEEMKAWQ